MKVAVITGSTRPGRKNEAVARWVYELARKRNDADFELVDIKDYELPLLDEPVPANLGEYSQPHTKVWSAKIEAFDAYVFVTPEYNHSTSAALKNAIDYLDREWNNKAAGFVSYGAVSGARAVEHLRMVLANLKVATVHAQVMLSLFTDFENFVTFQPDRRHQQEVHTMLDQVIAWGGALRWLRTPLAKQACACSDGPTTVNTLGRPLQAVRVCTPRSRCADMAVSCQCRGVRSALQALHKASSPRRIRAAKPEAARTPE